MRRRQFITRCSVACAAIGVVEVPSLLAAGPTPPSAARHVARETFATLVGTRFRVYDGARFSDALKLSRIADGPASAPGLDQFTLHFGGAFSPDLPQGTYSLVDATGATHEMHLEPTASRSYRATFCLLSDTRTR